MSAEEKHFYRFGPFSIDPVKRRLLREGEPLPLTPKAFDTLVALIEESGKTIEKNDLMRKVWPDAVVEENNLNQNITALRKLLGDSRQESRYIATVPGIGYRFVGDVSRLINDGHEEVETETAPPTQATPASTTTNTARFSGQALRVSLIVLAAVLLATLAYWLFKQAGGQHSTTLKVASIVVLPLENLSGDPSQEYFADGMTDTLIGDLAKISGLRVISRTSSMHYKGTKKALPQIADELKVDAVVEGTVQRLGDRVRVRAQLIHAPTDQHLWVETYERDVQNILDLQSEIAQAIAREVHIKMSPAEQARLTPGSPVHPKAFDHYLQGRYLFWNKRTEENLRKAIEHFQSAIREDSSYALPYVGLADCYNALGSVQIGTLPPIEARQRAEEAAVKALEIDSALAEAHSALGYVKHFNWDWNGAEQAFKRAIELNANNASARISYASYLMSRGRVDEAIATSNRARELDPFSLSISVQRGFLLENARRYGEAIEQLTGVIAMDQNNYQAHWMLGHTYAVAGQFEPAIATSEKAVTLSGRAPGALGMLGMIYGLAGRKGEAQQILQELLELNKSRYVTPAALVYVYIGLGDKDQAFAWLEKAYDERSNFVTYLKVVPVADPLRSDPRFNDLMRRVGLPQ